MTFENTRYGDKDQTFIISVVDGSEIYIPVAPGNRHYEELKSGGVAIRPYVEPPIVEIVPSSITPYQAQTALFNAGLFDLVESLIEQAPKPVQIAWRSALAVERNSPFIELMADQLGMSKEEVDQLFIAASKI